MALPTRVVLSGNQAFLRTAILDSINEYYRLKNLEIEGGGGSTHRTVPTYVRGKIFVRLYFKGIIQGTTADHNVEKSFRLMKIDPATVSLDQIKAVGQAVHNKFNNFSFTTGRESYCYNDPDNGFAASWGYFSGQADAMRVYENMLDIVQASPDWRRLTVTNVVQPGNRFSEPPEKVMQAGVNVRTDRERPVATVKFVRATIKFPKVRKEIPLVNEFGGILNSLEFLHRLGGTTQNPPSTS